MKQEAHFATKLDNEVKTKWGFLYFDSYPSAHFRFQTYWRIADINNLIISLHHLRIINDSLVLIKHKTIYNTFNAMVFRVRSLK